MNILWKQADETLVLVQMPEKTDPVYFIQVLQDQGQVHPTWQLCGANVTWSSDTRWKQETYRWDGKNVIVDHTAAIEETKNRLIQERAPLLVNIEQQIQQNLAAGIDSTSLFADKQRLLDLTNIDPNLTLDQLYTLKAL